MIAAIEPPSGSRKSRVSPHPSACAARIRLGLLGLLLVGCTPITPLRLDSGTDGGDDGGSVGDVPDASMMDAGAPSDGGLTGTIHVTPLLENRSRLGARSTRGFRPWRGGVAVVGSWLYWVESGSSPGLYRMPPDGCPGGGPSCVETVTAVTRPSAFAATSDAVLVADVTNLRRYPLTGSSQPIATGSSELVNLATDGMTAFWTTENAPILRTPFGGVTSTIINSNGTPYAMAVAGGRVHWVGVDISGLQAVMQSARTDGTNPREDRRSGNGFQTMGGNPPYLYFARDSPAQVLRLTMSTSMLEVVATNAQGVSDFALDAQWAYWVEPGTSGQANGRLRRVSHESTTPETVAESIAWPVAVAVDQGVVFVLSAGTSTAGWADGRVLRITRD